MHARPYRRADGMHPRVAGPGFQRCDTIAIAEHLQESACGACAQSLGGELRIERRFQTLEQFRIAFVQQRFDHDAMLHETPGHRFEIAGTVHCRDQARESAGIVGLFRFALRHGQRWTFHDFLLRTIAAGGEYGGGEYGGGDPDAYQH